MTATHLPRDLQRTFTACLAALALWAAPAAAQESGKRLALIVGNDAYSISPLKNAVNDARAMDKALAGAGFQTILRENADRVAMENAIIDFVQKLGPDDTALFFYAGHGVQIQNENFLIPVDFEAGASIAAAKVKATSFTQLVEFIKERNPKRTIFILDACRSNPVAKSQALQAGLAQQANLGTETYIALSTSPNSVALDNPDGRNSYFTEALADFIGQPALTIDEVFNRVRNRVLNVTEKQQNPWSNSSLTGRFYFHPPGNVDSENDPTMIEKWLADAQRHEQRGEWTEAIDGLEQIVNKHPGGDIEQAAASRKPYLLARREAQTKYDAGDFGAAAVQFEKALALDPFAIDAAVMGANSYLVNDQLPDALRVIKALRVRGTTDAIAKADAMLKELAAVSPEAGQELKSGPPQPPPVGEIFACSHFGLPDFEAGQRYLKSNPVEMARWYKELTPVTPAFSIAPQPGAEAPPPAPQPPAEAAAAAPPPPVPDIFHVEIVTSAGTRDLSIRQVNHEVGFVQFDGLGNIPVLLDGRPATQPAPGKIQLSAGKYEIRAVKNGVTLYSSELELKPLSTATITIHPQ